MLLVFSLPRRTCSQACSLQQKTEEQILVERQATGQGTSDLLLMMNFSFFPPQVNCYLFVLNEQNLARSICIVMYPSANVHLITCSSAVTSEPLRLVQH